MQSQSLLETVEKLQTLLASAEGTSPNKEVRRQACNLARKVWIELEEPGDLVDRLIYQPEENAILSLALNLGIYEDLAQRDSPARGDEIATSKGVQPVLMDRILRNLAALGHIDEIDVNTFSANKFTRAFTTPKGVTGAKFSFEFASHSWSAMPKFLESIQYKNPTDPVKTPTQIAFNSDKHFFELLVERDQMENFQTFMSSYRTDRAEFLDIFPAEDRLIHGYDSSTGDQGVLLVDIGGGLGHDIQKFVDKFPQKKGRMILEELDDVVKQVPKSDVMEVMVHDFFTSQPVKDARCYYLRMILHDWPDEQCVAILKNIASSMKPGYSKVLVNDVVFPDKGATRFATQSDFAMLALLGAMERSEAQWRRLFEQAGLQVVKIWPGTPESVIEAELA